MTGISAGEPARGAEPLREGNEERSDEFSCEGIKVGYDSVPITDEELMMRVRDDDMDAYDVLVKRYEKRLLNFIYRLLQGLDEAEDLFQETFLRVFRSRKRYRAKANFSTWLYTIASNLCMDRLRKSGRQKTTSLDQAFQGRVSKYDVLPDYSLAPDVVMEREELQIEIQTALSSLPVHQRIVVIMSEYEGLKYFQIATALGCSVGTVKSRVHRARKQLKQVLSKFIFDEEKVK